MNKPKKHEKNNDISKVIVIGTSMGGLYALEKLIKQLQKDFPLPILVVKHLAADASGNAVIKRLNEIGNITCQHAKNGAKLKPGNLYLAPSDHHLMINGKHSILITKGAHENRARPAIDTLFRSAAVAFGNGLIGIIMTGYLDDGTAGMKAIKRCGGICIVQDPADADYPDMPNNVLNNVDVDYSLPINKMGELLYKLIPEKLGNRIPVPEDILTEATIAERVSSDLSSVNELGDQVPFNCPGCGGVLWKVTKGLDLRFRCHTGHAYTAASLLSEQAKKIEETMWTALRMFEERKNLLSTVGTKSAHERAQVSQVHIDRIRAILKTDEKESRDVLN
jgi:two-component system, chemotaxis family, protein-glutamate methylesterase/glutaminase